MKECVRNTSCIVLYCYCSSGYVRLHTSLGELNLELHCDMVWPTLTLLYQIMLCSPVQVPLACENFIRHCQDGYYDNCIFHRSIRNFMVCSLSFLQSPSCSLCLLQVQGGDPTGSGTGSGQSVWLCVCSVISATCHVVNSPRASHALCECLACNIRWPVSLGKTFQR